MSVSVKLDTTVLDNIMRDLNINTDEAVKSIAYDVEGDAKIKVPVKTGNLKSSIGVRPIKSKLYWVEAKADYAAYVELGTYKMSAQPYLGPAVEVAAKRLSEQFKRLFE